MALRWLAAPTAGLVEDLMLSLHPQARTTPAVRQEIARSSSVAFQGSLCGRLEWSWQSCAPRLRHLRMVSVLTLKRSASTPVGSLERAISWRTAGGGAGLRMKGEHQILHQARGGRREPSKRQV